MDVKEASVQAEAALRTPTHPKYCLTSRTTLDRGEGLATALIKTMGEIISRRGFKWS